MNNDESGKNVPSSQSTSLQEDEKNAGIQQPLKKHWFKATIVIVFIIVIVVGIGLLGYLKPNWLNLKKYQSNSSAPISQQKPSHSSVLSQQHKPKVQQPYHLPTPTSPSSTYQEKIILAYLATLTDLLTFELQYHSQPEIIHAIVQRIQLQSLRLNKNPTFMPLQSKVNILMLHIQALPTLTPNSTMGLFYNLHDKVAELNLNLYPLKDFKTNNEESTEQPISWYQKILDKLSTLIIIRHHQKQVEPLLSPTQNFYLKVNLQLVITQAEIAFQTENWLFAIQHLTTIRENLQNYFDLTTEDGKQALQILGKLENFAKSMAHDHHEIISNDIMKINEIIEMKLNEN